MKYLISYGDDRYKLSLMRIAHQARQVGIFDRIIKYTPKDLPEYIKASPLFAFERGGGYWCWKPYVVYHTLNNCKEGDIIIYVDAGCSLLKDSPEWDYFMRLIDTHSAVFFHYRNDYDYGWKSVNEDSSDIVAIKHWMKPSLIQYYNRFISPEILDFEKIWAGFFIVKKTETIIKTLETWYKMTLFHPDLIMDPLEGEIPCCHADFYEHRHDQAVLSPLVYHFQSVDNTIVLPETSESKVGKPAVVADRWRQGRSSLFWMLKYMIWHLLH
ncbi:MAG: hypothetical protein J5907_06550 [Bacteroidales bacterium]|nr:hypothetical protein [Bacteroidales bacterium]